MKKNKLSLNLLSGILIGTLFTNIAGATRDYLAKNASFPVIVNGKTLVTDKPIVTIDGSTYLPLRAMGSALGVSIVWNESLKRVEVGKAPSTAAPKPKPPITTPTEKYSIHNPAPMGVTQTFNDQYEYTHVQLIETIRGDMAWEMIYNANKFNTPPREGYEYILAKFVVAPKGVKDNKSLSISEFDFDVYSQSNVEYERESIVLPEPKLRANAYAGGTTQGYVGFLVKKGDSPKAVYKLEYDGTGGVWFAL